LPDVCTLGFETLLSKEDSTLKSLGREVC